MSTDPFGLVGQVLDGQFRVDELVGEGGFSAVYRGHHLGLNEPIAIKSLKLPVALQSSLVDTFVQRFRDESRLLYRLSQGNLHIVRSIAAGTTSSTTGVLVPFMVLEWLNGRSLAADFAVRRELGKAGRSLPEILQAFATAADALSFAHGQGVVHRDLNPGNFFLANTNAGIRMKVLDFGVAKVMHDSTLGLGPRAQTVGQFRIFAPAYGAPEQFDDGLGPVGAASDVYSFALVLLEALRDEPVNEGENLADFARFAVDPARRPTPRALGMNVAEELEAVFVRATQLDPRSRFQTVAELWGALSSAANAKSVPKATSTGLAGKAAPPVQKTLPLGTNVPFPRPAPRPAAGAPATSKPVSIAKSTQRFAGAPPPGGGGPPVSNAASSSPGASARPTARPGPTAQARPMSTRPPAPTISAGEEEDVEESTKVAEADPRILELAERVERESTQVRDTELSSLPLGARTALGPPMNAPPGTYPREEPLDEDETKAADLSAPKLAVPAGRFGDTVATPGGAPLPDLGEDDDDRGPDSGGTLIMAPGQTTGKPIAEPSSGSLRVPTPTGLGATLALSPSQHFPTAPRAGQPSPAADASWPGTAQSLPTAPPTAPPPPQTPMYAGQSQLYPQQGAVGPGGYMQDPNTALSPGQQPPNPAMNAGQSQLYPPQGGFPGQAPGPMYPAQAPGQPGPMHSPSMPGQPPVGYAAQAYPAHGPGEAPPPPKKTPVVVLGIAGLLLLVGLGGIGAFLVVGRDGKGGAGTSGSASGAPSGVTSVPPPASAPPPAEPEPSPPPVAEVVDAAAPEPVAEAPSAPVASATTAPTTTAPVYTWPPAGGNTTPTTPVTPTPTPTVKDAGAPADPNAWSESAARSRLSQANGVLVACRREGGISGPGKAMVTFAPDGTVSSVSLDAPYVGTKEGDCASRQFQRAKVNPFTGGPRSLTHSFDIPK